MLLVHRAVRFFIFLLFFTAFVALGHRAKADTTASVEKLSCEAGQCAPEIVKRGFRLEVDPATGPMLLLEKSNQANQQPVADPQLALVVGKDLEARVQNSEMTPEQAEEVYRELMQFDGVYYGFPGLEEMKMTLGFPSDAELLTEDLYELARVHMQVTLGTSPLTASYLTNSLALSDEFQVSPSNSAGVLAAAVVAPESGASPDSSDSSGASIALDPQSP